MAVGKGPSKKCFVDQCLVTAAGPSRNCTGVPCLSVPQALGTDHQHTNHHLSGPPMYRGRERLSKAHCRLRQE